MKCGLYFNSQEVVGKIKGWQCPLSSEGLNNRQGRLERFKSVSH